MICRKAGQPKCEARFIVTKTGQEHRCARPATMTVDGKRYCGPCGAKNQKSFEAGGKLPMLPGGGA